LLVLIFFTRRYLIVKELIPANAGNQKLISEPLVSGTDPDSRESRAFSLFAPPGYLLELKIQRNRKPKHRGSRFVEVADPGFN